VSDAALRKFERAAAAGEPGAWSRAWAERVRRGEATYALDVPRFDVPKLGGLGACSDWAWPLAGVSVPELMRLMVEFGLTARSDPRRRTLGPSC